MSEYVPPSMIITPIYTRQYLKYAPEFFLTRVWGIGVALIIFVLFALYFSFFICVWHRYRVFSMVTKAEHKKHSASSAAARVTLGASSPLSQFYSTTTIATNSSSSSSSSSSSPVNNSISGFSYSTSSLSSQHEQLELHEHMQEYEFKYGASSNPNNLALYPPTANTLYTMNENELNNWNNDNDEFNANSGNAFYTMHNPLTFINGMNNVREEKENELMQSPMQLNRLSTLNVLQPRSEFTENRRASLQMEYNQPFTSFVQPHIPVYNNNYNFSNAQVINTRYEQRKYS